MNRRDFLAATGLAGLATAQQIPASDIVFLPLLDLAAGIRKGTFSSVEVLEAHLAQIARHNPSVNAVVTRNEQGARSRAAEADRALAAGDVWGPLHGVPVTFKDVFQTAGIRTTAGFPPMANYVPQIDATVVARLKASGAIVLGKTNTPVLANGFATENPIFGMTRNPWNTMRSPGGSSGGSAAAVAAGFSPLDIGSDFNGSLRIPAHYCGVYSLKPTENIVAQTGHIPPPLETPDRTVRHMPVAGPIARSADDLALVLLLLAGTDGFDWEVPPVRLDKGAPKTLSGLRVAWIDEFPEAPVTNDTRTGLERLMREIESRGSRVEKRMPDALRFPEIWEDSGELSQAQIVALMPPAEQDRQVANWQRFPDNPIFRGYAKGSKPSFAQYIQALNRRDARRTSMERFFLDFDVFVCPAGVRPAPPPGAAPTTLMIDGRSMVGSMSSPAYPDPFSYLGLPVVTMPVLLSSEGLPIGVQLVGKAWGDLDLLSVAALLAEIVGPTRRPPGF